MYKITRQRKSRGVFKLVALCLIVTFSWGAVYPAQVRAQGAPHLSFLPAPGAMVNTSPVFFPPVLKGLKVYPKEPFKFNFIVDSGDENLKDKALKDESTKLIKYFLASLTISENDLWVNLSPYEKDRIIPDEFGLTEMGRDLLAQDYLLKQLTASLIYPKSELGEKFWKRMKKEAYERYGVSDIPVDTFNKVWIVPERAVVYENGDTAFVGKSYLKVMLEEDYVAQTMSTKDEGRRMRDDFSSIVLAKRSTIVHRKLTSELIKEIILPAIEHEINNGKNFANLRQIYHSLILATWYKKRLKEGLLAKAYVDKSKVKGVDVADKDIKHKIYDQYLQAYRKGVYNFIKEDIDPATNQIIPRKYFSGGFGFAGRMDAAMVIQNPPFLTNVPTRGALHKVAAGVTDAAILSAEGIKSGIVAPDLPGSIDYQGLITVSPAGDMPDVKFTLNILSNRDIGHLLEVLKKPLSVDVGRESEFIIADLNGGIHPLGDGEKIDLRTIIRTRLTLPDQFREYMPIITRDGNTITIENPHPIHLLKIAYPQKPAKDPAMTARGEDEAMVTKKDLQRAIELADYQMLSLLKFIIEQLTKGKSIQLDEGQNQIAERFFDLIPRLDSTSSLIDLVGRFDVKEQVYYRLREAFVVRDLLLKDLRNLGDERSIPILVEILNTETEDFVHQAAQAALDAISERIGQEKAKAVINSVQTRTKESDDPLERRLHTLRALEKLNVLLNQMEDRFLWESIANGTIHFEKFNNENLIAHLSPVTMQDVLDFRRTLREEGAVVLQNLRRQGYKRIYVSTLSSKIESFFKAVVKTLNIKLEEASKSDEYQEIIKQNRREYEEYRGAIAPLLYEELPSDYSPQLFYIDLEWVDPAMTARGGDETVMSVRPRVLNQGQGPVVLTTLDDEKWKSVLSEEKGARVVHWHDELQIREPSWTANEASFATVNHHFKIMERIERLVEQRKDDRTPIVVLMWGIGQGKEIHGLLSEIKKRKIPNIKVIGYADEFYPQWHQLDRDAVLIFDVLENLPMHLKWLQKQYDLPRISLITSYRALNNLAIGWARSGPSQPPQIGRLIQHYQALKPLMDPDHGEIVLSQQTLDALELSRAGFVQSSGSYADYETHAFVLRPQQDEAMTAQASDGLRKGQEVTIEITQDALTVNGRPHPKTSLARDHDVYHIAFSHISHSFVIDQLVLQVFVDPESSPRESLKDRLLEEKVVAQIQSSIRNLRLGDQDQEESFIEELRTRKVLREIGWSREQFDQAIEIVQELFERLEKEGRISIQHQLRVDVPNIATPNPQPAINQTDSTTPTQTGDVAMVGESSGGGREISDEEFYQKVWVLRTGGTVEMSGEEGRRSVNAVEQLIEQNSDDVVYSEKVFEDLPDSSDIGPNEWNIILAKLRRIIRAKRELGERLRKKGQDPGRAGGIVITAGTDTIDQLGLVIALELAPDLDFPIVLTAADKPLDVSDSDAPLNFNRAVSLAQNQEIPPNVYFVYNEKIHLASQIKKFIASQARREKSITIQASQGSFESYGAIVGEWRNDILEVNSWIKEFENAPRPWQRQDHQTINFAHVEHLLVDKMTPLKVFEDTARRLNEIKSQGNHVGLVIQGSNRSFESRFIIEDLIDAGIPVMTGSTRMQERWGRSDIMLLPQHITYAKARTKLSWLLAQGIPFEEIESEMNQNYVGEVPDIERFPISHHYETPPRNDFEQGTDVIVAYPGMHVNVISDAIKRLQDSDADEKKFIIIGFGDGHLPVGSTSLAQRVFQWLPLRFPQWGKNVETNIGAVAEKLGDQASPLQILEQAVSDEIRKLKPDQLGEILLEYQIWRTKPLVGEIINEMFRKASFEEQQGFVESAKNLLGVIKADYPIFDHAPPFTPKKDTIEHLRTYLKEFFRTLSSEALLELIQRKPSLLVHRLIKDALRTDEGSLIAWLAEATDQGIKVEIRTNAYRSKSDTLFYDIGNILLAAGVDSQITAGWPAFLIPQNDVTAADEAMVGSMESYTFQGEEFIIEQDLAPLFRALRQADRIIELGPNGHPGLYHMINREDFKGQYVAIDKPRKKREEWQEAILEAIRSSVDERLLHIVVDGAEKRTEELQERTQIHDVFDVRFVRDLVDDDFPQTIIVSDGAIPALRPEKRVADKFHRGVETIRLRGLAYVLTQFPGDVQVHFKPRIMNQYMDNKLYTFMQESGWRVIRLNVKREKPILAEDEVWIFLRPNGQVPEALQEFIDELKQDSRWKKDAAMVSQGPLFVSPDAVMIWDRLENYVQENPWLTKGDMDEAVRQIASEYAFITDRIDEDSALPRGTTLGAYLRQRADEESNSVLAALAISFADHVDEIAMNATGEQGRQQQEKIRKELEAFPDDIDMEFFNEKLDELLEESGESKAERARRSGIAPVSFYYWEDRRVESVRLINLIKLAIHYQKRAMYFLDGKKGEYFSYDLEMIHKSLGQHIRKIRQAKSVLRSELARKLSKHVGSLRGIEYGETPPSILVLIQIAKELNVLPEQFFKFPIILEEEPGTVEGFAQGAHLPRDDSFFPLMGQRLKDTHSTKTQETVAQESEVSLARVHAIERGKFKGTDIEYIFRFIDYSGLPTFSAVTGKRTTGIPLLEGEPLSINNYAENLRRLRKARKLTQEQLAQRAGVSPDTISNNERGVVPKFGTFIGAARGLMVPPKVLLASPQKVEEYIRIYMSPIPSGLEWQFLAADPIYLGALLKEHRERAQKTAGEIARYFGRAPETIERIEAGLLKINSLKIAFEYAEYLGLSIVHLLTGQESLEEAEGQSLVLLEYAMVEKYFGKNLVRIMEEKGISIAALAKKINMRKDRLSDIRTGDVPTLRDFAGFVKALEVGIAELVQPHPDDMERDFVNIMHHLDAQDKTTEELSTAFDLFFGVVISSDGSWEQVWQTEIMPRNHVRMKDLPRYRDMILTKFEELGIIEREGETIRLTPWRFKEKVVDVVGSIPETRADKNDLWEEDGGDAIVEDEWGGKEIEVLDEEIFDSAMVSSANIVQRTRIFIRRKKIDQDVGSNIGMKVKFSDRFFYYVWLDYMGLNPEYAHQIGLDRLLWLWWQYVKIGDRILDGFGDHFSDREIAEMLDASVRTDSFPIIPKALLNEKGITDEELTALGIPRSIDGDNHNPAQMLEEFGEKADLMIEALPLEPIQQSKIRHAFVQTARDLFHSYILERQYGLYPSWEESLNLLSAKTDVSALLSIREVLNSNAKGSKQRAVKFLKASWLLFQIVDDWVDIEHDFGSQPNLILSVAQNFYPQEFRRLEAFYQQRGQLPLLRLSPRTLWRGGVFTLKYFVKVFAHDPFLATALLVKWIIKSQKRASTDAAMMSDEQRFEDGIYDEEGVFNEDFNDLELARRVLEDKKSKFSNRDAAAEILGIHGDERFIPVLINSTQDPNRIIRAASVTALERIGLRLSEEARRRAIIPALIEVRMKDEDMRVKSQAFKALQKLDAGFKRTLDLNLTLTELKNDLEDIAGDKDITIILSLPEQPVLIENRDGRGSLKWDVFRELIFNAFKYTLPNGRIKVTLRQEEDEVQVVIEDTGIGIPEEEKRRIWASRFRGNAAKALDRGTGLGLGVAKIFLLENYKGKVYLKESEVGKGSTFVVELPIGDVPDYYAILNTGENTSAKPDQAMTATPGGIDLNPNRMAMEIEGQSDEAILAPAPVQEEYLQIEGLVPIIYSITPLQSLSPFLLSRADYSP